MKQSTKQKLTYYALKLFWATVLGCSACTGAALLGSFITAEAFWLWDDYTGLQIVMVVFALWGWTLHDDSNGNID